MKKLTVALFFCGVSAFAASVTFATSATLSGLDALGNNLINGAATITFTGQPSTSVDAPTNISLGFFTVSGGAGTFSTDSIILTITQTSPSPGSGTSSSSIAGQITSASNGISVTFAPTLITIGGEIYNLLPEYLLVPPNTNGGVTTVEATLTPETVPEPLSFGLGLIGLLLIALRGALRQTIRPVF